MAQTVETVPREWSLDDYVADLIVTLGCERDAALWEMWGRIATRRLLFIRQRLVDGKPYNPPDGKLYDPEVVSHSYFRSNYNFDFDRHDRVRVVSQDWFVFRYTVREPPDSLASQTAPDQQPEGKTGPDPVEADDGLSAGQSPQGSKAEGWQAHRVKEALKEKFPPDGHPVDMTLTAILKSLDENFKTRGWKLASLDTLARVMGRRRA